MRLSRKALENRCTTRSGHTPTAAAAHDSLHCAYDQRRGNLSTARSYLCNLNAVACTHFVSAHYLHSLLHNIPTEPVVRSGLLLAHMVRSTPLTSASVAVFAEGLTGSVLAYNVSGEPRETVSPASGLWSKLEVGPDPLVKPSEPALYVQAQDVNDVVESLRFAADNNLRASAYAAGHQVVGVSLLPNGIVIDTKNLTAIDVDPESPTAYVQAGAVGLELCEATVPYNLFWPTGFLGSVGVAGIVLGGGMGLGGSRVGASVDSVLGIDVVSTWENNTADWDIVRINATSQPDLFWGMLGGGAMLAAAVGFELQLHELPEGGQLQQATAIWPLPAAVEAFQWYSDWKETAPSDLDSGFELVTTPMGQAAVATFTNWDPANSSEVNEAMEAFMAGAIEAGALQVIPASTDLLEYLASYAARLPQGPLSYYVNDRYLQTVPDELVASLVEHYANATSPGYVVVFGSSPASVEGQDNAGTAFGYRDTWYIWVWPFWFRTPGGAAVDGDAEHIAWAEEGGQVLDEYAEGHYINMNRFDTPESTETCFPPPNWARLQQVKATYDPKNLFRPLDYFRTDGGFSGIAGNADYQSHK